MAKKHATVKIDKARKQRTFGGKKYAKRKAYRGQGR